MSTRYLACPDWAEFQPVVTDKYGRRVLILRVAFGAHYEDRNFASSAAVVNWLYRHGVIDGVILYQVWLATATPTEQFAFFRQLVGPVCPDWLIGVEIDLETWPGTSYEQHGDHSGAVNKLWALLCHYGRSWTFAGIYGNRSDLAELVPGRDRRAWVNVASYGPQLVYRSVRGAIAQQYTDGQAKWGVPSIGGQLLPRATAGVRSDHNLFDPKRFPTGKALRAFMRPAVAAPKPPVVTPPAAFHYHRTNAVARGIGSADDKTALFLNDDGHLEIRRLGKHVRSL